MLVYYVAIMPACHDNPCFSQLACEHADHVHPYEHSVPKYTSDTFAANAAFCQFFAMFAVAFASKLDVTSELSERWSVAGVLTPVPRLGS